MVSAAVSRAFAERAHSLGKHVEYELLEGATHSETLDGFLGDTRLAARIDAWLAEVLRRPMR